jgi:glycerol transport system substrate-binding protein
MMTKKALSVFVYSLVFSFAIVFFLSPAQAAVDEKTAAAIDKWINEFQPSAFSKEEQRKELEWFAEAAKPYRGMTITSCSETIAPHVFENDVLTKAFAEITGINAKHDLIGEGDVVDRIARQVQTRRKLYDIYINDADLIGWHLRSGGIVNLTEYMAGEGKAITNPYLDLDDFLNLEFGQDYDGNQLQLPDQQFSALYWYRHDWFNRPELQKAFKEKYGYDLGVPLNWSAYEDIAEFFTGREIDGKKAWGHFDFAKKGPDLGWRFTDAWLSIAGASDKGLPNGFPVDDWGIRVNDQREPVGASVERGGAVNSPAAIYALEKYLTWAKKYAPPSVYSVSATEMLGYAKGGDIAQFCFYYIVGLWDPGFHKPPMVDDQGNLNWRVAPVPHGKYWQEGMKVGYQDCGAWTIPKNVTGKNREAAWLWAQFCVSKTVQLKKFLYGNGPIRKSSIWHPYVTERIDKWGGVIEFYRSKYEKLYTDSGVNPPHYPLLAEQWWKNIGPALNGDITAETAMNNLAKDMDDLMGKMRLPKYNPKLNPIKPKEYWLNQPGAPWPEIKEREKPQTMKYEELVEKWKQ